MKSHHKGLKRIIKAFSYSFDGFVSAFKSEEAFRQDLLVCSIALIIAIVVPVTIFEKLLLTSSLVLILLMELINTAIEVVIDRISEDYNILSKKAKDIGSLLVLISFVNAAFMWVTILYKNFLQ